MKYFMMLLALLALSIPLAAQEDDMQPITLYFAAAVGEESAVCGESYAGVSVDEATILFEDFRFYVSNIQLITEDGELVPLALEQDELWQYETVALLDFEDCNTEALNGEVRGMAPAGDYVGVQFDMGVPFELNHQDVTSAPSPLNIAAMFWSWQGGYKFIRVDLVTDAEVDTAWNIHIGSTGCDSPASVIAPEDLCARPNIVTVTFDEFDAESNVIVADLAGLLEAVPLYENTLMPPGCMSGVDDPDCPALFSGFGLSLEDGACPDGLCASQTFFRVDDVDNVSLVERSEMMMTMPMDNSEDGHSG